MAEDFREMAGSTVLGRVRLRPIRVSLTAVGLVRVRQKLETPEICIQGDATVVIAGKFLFYEVSRGRAAPSERPARRTESFKQRLWEKKARKTRQKHSRCRRPRPLTSTFNELVPGLDHCDDLQTGLLSVVC